MYGAPKEKELKEMKLVKVVGWLVILSAIGWLTLQMAELMLDQM